MTSPVPGAYVVKNSSVAFGASDFAIQLSKVRLVPDTPVQTMRTLVPGGIVQDVDDPAWTLELGGVQDWTLAQGLSRYLYDHRSEAVTVVITPKAGGVTATCTVLAMATDFGGEQGEWAEIDIELPVQGQPEFDDPA